MEKTENCLERSLGAASYGITRQAQKWTFFPYKSRKKHHRQRQEQNQMKPLGLKIENSYEKGFNIDFS